MRTAKKRTRTLDADNGRPTPDDFPEVTAAKQRLAELREQKDDTERRLRQASGERHRPERDRRILGRMAELLGRKPPGTDTEAAVVDRAALAEERDAVNQAYSEQQRVVANLVVDAARECVPAYRDEHRELLANVVDAVVALREAVAAEDAFHERMRRAGIDPSAVFTRLNFNESGQLPRAIRVLRADKFRRDNRRHLK